MSEKLRVGIVGASGWMAGALAVGVEYDAAGYDTEKRSGNKNGQSVVTALCDLNAPVMDKVRDELGLGQAKCFTSYTEMLASDVVDAVVIAVPNHLHVPLSIQALESGKHLFLEKPYATTREGSHKLTAALEGCSLTTKLDYIMVHYDEQEKLRQLIEQRAFGELASIHFTYRHPIQAGQSEGQKWKLSREKSGGAVPMGICHAIAQTVFLIGESPESVICQTRAPKIREFDYHTQIDLMITFANGVVGLVQGNIDFAEKYDARHTVIGTGGQFDYTPHNPLESRVSWSSKALGRKYSTDPTFAKHHLDSGDVWKHQCSRTIQDFVALAREGKKDSLLGLDSPLVQRVEAIIWAAEESAAKGSQPVALTVG
ncbi:MAG: Gfo/Idh/MocA family oxidoreductase [Acidobacteriota bacterium]|nr:MAG: Gfo/Idh/MocA family oxidoreductase [Acidobacteriota bacterium]